jgi:hypothetical protein
MFVKTVIAEYIREMLFRVRWLAMSDRQRYAYLWNRTKETL